MLLVFLTSFVIVIVFAVRLYTGPIQATNDYYTDLRYGRYTAAYRELCSLKRRQTTLAEFVAEQKSDEQTKGRVGAFDFSSSELSNDNTIIDAVTTGTVERGGSEYDVKVSLRKEDGDWKVCNAAER